MQAKNNGNITKNDDGDDNCDYDYHNDNNDADVLVI